MNKFRAIIVAALCAVAFVACAPEVEEELVLDTPEGVSLSSATTTTLTIEWRKVANATGYFYRYTDVAKGNHFSGEVENNSLTLSGLEPDSEYQFSVRAENGEVKSPMSERITFKTKALSDEGGDEGDEGGDEGGSGEGDEGGSGEGDEGDEGDEGGSDEGDEGGSDEGDDPVVTPTNPDNAVWQLPAHENDGVVRAFPGAEGGGMYTTGGRGGTVYHVTNLNDSGEGSLRWAVGKSGPRIIVFDVCGTIHLQSSLRINYGDLTIAGQTAPGDGICIAGRTVQVSASNVIIRFVRFRLGNEDTSQEDAIWGRYNSNIILDHCSMSWSIDEGSSFYANKNFTMQWCIVAEALKNAGHKKGAHGYGGIWGGKNASFHHNLLAHNDSRNPRFDHPEVYDNYVTSHRGNCDYRNNVVYNWGGNSTYGGEGAWWNVVGNYYKPGPASKERKYFVDANGIYSSSKTDYGYATMYVSGNYHAGSYASDINTDNWSGIKLHDGSGVSNYNSWKSYSVLPIRKDDSQQCYTTTHTASTAFSQVLAWAGCSLERDSVDERVTKEAKEGNYTYTGSNGGTKGIIDSHTDVDGWPTLSATSDELSKVTDTDGDGMPDWFEKEFGTNYKVADGNSITLDKEGRYNNLDIYLHYLVREVVAAQTKDGNYDAIK